MTRKLPAQQCAVIGANIRTLRQRNGWTQARLGALMGWDANDYPTDDIDFELGGRL